MSVIVGCFFLSIAFVLVFAMLGHENIGVAIFLAVLCWLIGGGLTLVLA